MNPNLRPTLPAEAILSVMREHRQLLSRGGYRKFGVWNLVSRVCYQLAAPIHFRELTIHGGGGTFGPRSLLSFIQFLLANPGNMRNLVNRVTIKGTKYGTGHHIWYSHLLQLLSLLSKLEMLSILGQTIEVDTSIEFGHTPGSARSFHFLQLASCKVGTGGEPWPAVFSLVTKFSEITHLELEGVGPIIPERPVVFDDPLPQVLKTQIHDMKLEPSEYPYSGSLEPYLSHFIDMPNVHELQLGPTCEGDSEPDNDMLVNVLNLATGLHYLELCGFQKFPYPFEEGVMPTGYMLSLASCVTLDSICFDIDTTDAEINELACLRDSLLCCAESISTLPASSYIVPSSGRPEWRSPISTIDINIVLSNNSREFVTNFAGNGQIWAKMGSVLKQRKFAGIRGVFLNFEIRKGGSRHDQWVETTLEDITNNYFNQSPLNRAVRLDVTFVEADNGSGEIMAIDDENRQVVGFMHMHQATDWSELRRIGNMAFRGFMG